jgi:hypothetical protein
MIFIGILTGSTIKTRGSGATSLTRVVLANPHAKMIFTIVNSPYPCLGATIDSSLKLNSVTSKNSFPHCGPTRPPRDHDLNKIESAQCQKLSCQFKLFWPRGF